MEDWSNEAMEKAARCYLGMSKEQFESRLNTMAQHGEKQIEDYFANLTIPPYVVTALRIGDHDVIEDFRVRRGADYSFEQWLALNKVLKASGADPEFKVGGCKHE